MTRRIVLFAALLILLTAPLVIAAPAPDRREISLDGAWQMTETREGQEPAKFDRQAPVPGLADMAQPPFEAVGEKTSANFRSHFWYRRTFTVDGPVPAVAILKFHKAAYGLQAFLNGRSLGEHLPCFTPAYFNVRDGLKGNGETNELVVRVGATREALPKGMPDGHDFEKTRYIPGIYDSVELILTGSPRVVRMQTVPDIAGQTVRVVATLAGGGKANPVFRVREVSTGNVVGEAKADPISVPAGEERTVDVKIPLKPCRLWSPEDPFLYELETATGADTLRVRFGMREFRFDAVTGRAMLNGKPYYLRGTNVCIFRFFEDPPRGDRPWRQEWVRRLHRALRSMNWNSIRYCIGFPPEAWYRIADEEGLLIQDEFPIWYLDKWPADLKSDAIIKEYTEWMQERWNHPCVVIWDAQNETRTAETGKAIQAVRGLDLSNRPWDNGWAAPQSPTDVFEAHPYLMQNPSFRMADIVRTNPKPGSVIPNTGNNPVIINEYAWLWLNRDGSVTTLSKGNYERLLGPGATADQRFYTYARLLAAKTEFWRCHRQVAGVLEFCGLGYSRPDGQTSDHFIDLEQLTFEPHFKALLGDAFAPVGLMIDLWADELPPGKPRDVPVVVINDLYADWDGTVRLRLTRDGKEVWQAEQPCKVLALGSQTLTFHAAIPPESGKYQLVAELVAPGKPPVRSLRDFAVLTDAERQAREGLARGKPVQASSTVTRDGESFPPEGAVDGNSTTRWSSEFSDPQWIAVDLGKPTTVSRVELAWEGAFGKAYAIQVSADGKAWQDVHKTDSGKGGLETIRFKPVEARWVRMLGTQRGTAYGYSLWEFRVFP